MTEVQEIDRRLNIECNEINEDSESDYSISDRSAISDDSFQFNDESTREFFEEMPPFSIKCFSPCGRTPSPIASNEPLSLLNLSISPIGSNYDEYTENDDTRTSNADFLRNSEMSGQEMIDIDEEERVSLDDITAQINTPPQTMARGSSKRLNLETIFEGVFLETPPKKKRYDTWHMRTIREVTVERINTYVIEQQQKTEWQLGNNNDSSEHLCRLFDEHIDLD